MHAWQRFRKWRYSTKYNKHGDVPFNKVQISLFLNILRVLRKSFLFQNGIANLDKDMS